MLKVSKVELTSGVSFHPAALTVVIGPNNGGKSQFLRDIKAKISTPRAHTPSVLDADIEALPSWRALLDKLASNLKKDEKGNLIFDRLGVDLVKSDHLRHHESNVQPFMVNESRQQHVDQQKSALEFFGHFYLANLGTETRLNLIARQKSVEAHIVGPSSVAGAMHAADTKVINWINEQVRGAFQSDLIVDDSVLFQIGIVLGDAEAVPTHHQERRIALGTLRKAEEQGDGVRAYCGVVAAAATTDRSIVLIDEPEAFLHPPQALLMGRALARLNGMGAQVFVATHSAEVLRGIIGETTDVQILRLTETDSGFRSRLIDSKDLREISRDPLLSSARVLDGLFYRGVVIAESDSDVAIYRQVLEQADGSGSIHFLNAYGKSAAIKMTAPYRNMGTGHAVIVDFDILRDGLEFQRLVEALGGSWEDFRDDYRILMDEIEAADRPEDRVAAAEVAIQDMLGIIRSDKLGRDRLAALRHPIRLVRDKASAWSELKKKGREGLSEDGRGLFDKIEAQSASIGLFIVPCGERESWLPGIVDYSRNKSAWTEDALSAVASGNLQNDHPLRVFMERVRKFVLA
ncbi:AAA family ATPase [Sphingopyxis microcysteis]|uniref:AAA family ATPase n=1 Tax=Sphingopyxis microcysteis TaxID=2484145 RepID=UPI001446ACB7|nr:AAA family ATPase [Sphingopyxis microcysteis]